MPRKAFLVEDSEDVRELLIPALAEQAGLIVIAYAETEQDGIAWLRANSSTCDFVVVDLFLRQGTGLGVLAECGRICTVGQRIVVFTNHATPETRERCLRLGAEAVFDKASEMTNFLEYCAAAATEKK